VGNEEVIWRNEERIGSGFGLNFAVMIRRMRDSGPPARRWRREGMMLRRRWMCKRRRRG
jgi:hypothetical protein